MLDTNIVSEVRKGSRCNKSVAQWYRQVDAQELYISVLVLGEIRQGIERIRYRDSLQNQVLENWLERLEEEFRGRTLEVDMRVAYEWGRINCRKTVDVIDGFFAATAKIHQMTLVTRNVKNMRDLGVDILNPFDC